MIHDTFNIRNETLTGGAQITPADEIWGIFMFDVKHFGNVLIAMQPFINQWAGIL